MVKTPSDIKVAIVPQVPDLRPDDPETPAPVGQSPVERVGEVIPFDHFQAFEQPEPVTFAASYHYVGPGFIPGVPKGDLDAVTVQRLPSDLHREVAGSPFYKAIKE